MEREPGTQYVLSLSYGKDSMATIEACRLLGYPLDRIVTCEVWATDTINADLPPMVEFKAKADKIILERYGIEVEHICARNKDGSKKTYEQMFYHIPKRRTSKVTQPSEENGGGGDIQRKAARIPGSSRKLVQEAQGRISATRDSHAQRLDGAETSRGRTSTDFYGFPISVGGQLVYGSQDQRGRIGAESTDSRGRGNPNAQTSRQTRFGWQRVGGCQATSALKRDPLSASLSSRGYGATANSRKGRSTLF